MINKIVRKSMRKKMSLIIAIVILLVISSMFIGISHFVYDTMANNYEQIKTESNVEDFRIYTLPLAENFDKVYSEQFLTSFENKFAVSLELEEQATYSTSNEEEPIYSIIKYNDKDQINKIILEEGNYPHNQNEILIQPEAAIQSNLSIGDTISIDEKEYTISGTGYLVEYLMPSDFANNIIYPDFDKFMPIIMSEQSFDGLDRQSENLIFNKMYKGKFFDYKNNIKKRQRKYEQMLSYNELNIPILDDEGKPQITKTGQLVTEEISRFSFILDRQINPTITSVENEIQGSQTTFVFLAMVLSFITILLATVLINSVFKSQRREIGIMKAEGVSPAMLSFGFLGYIVLVLIISSIIGIVVSLFAAQAFRSVYDSMFMLKEYRLTDQIFLAVIKDIVIVLVVMSTSIYFISIRKNLKTPILNLIKNIDHEKLPKHNIGKIFKNLSFIRKYQLNLLIRNFSKTLLLTFSVIVSSFLLLLGVLMYDSAHNMADNMYGETFKFNYVVNYSNDAIKNEDEVENGTIAKQVDLVAVPNETDLDAPLTGNEKITFEAYDFDNSQTVTLHDTDGNKITNDYDGLIASSGFMKKYKLEIGDVISVRNPFVADEQIIDIEIVAETDEFFLPFVYIPIDVFQETFNIRDDMVNGYHSTSELTPEIRKQILNEDPNAFIYESADMEEMMGDSLKIVNISIIIIAIFASIIAFVALYTISSVIIDGNSKTISVMKVLGYSNKEIRKTTIGLYKWLVIIVYILSIPFLQILIQNAVDTAMRDMDFSIPIHLNLKLSFLGLILIYIVYILASNLTYRKIIKIKLADSLKIDE